MDYCAAAEEEEKEASEDTEEPAIDMLVETDELMHEELKAEEVRQIVLPGPCHGRHHHHNNNNNNNNNNQGQR
jgi:hypothetical protein